MSATTIAAFAACLGVDPAALQAIVDEELARPPEHRTDRPARGRNNARARHDGRKGVAHAHACAAARLGYPKLTRKLKKRMWRDDPEYFC